MTDDTEMREEFDPELLCELENELIAELDGFNPWTHGKYPIAMETLADKLVDLRAQIRVRILKARAERLEEK
jgi:hypothetical protein